MKLLVVAVLGIALAWSGSALAGKAGDWAFEARLGAEGEFHRFQSVFATREDCMHMAREYAQLAFESRRSRRYGESASRPKYNEYNRNEINVRISLPNPCSFVVFTYRCVPIS
jgi:hypothetical protein